jgi:hypothetical protein
MIGTVVEKLKTGTIKNVVPFGSKLPAAPYVVVKQEPAPDNETRFRIIVHAVQGSQIIILNPYIFNELSTLLSGFSAEDEVGNQFLLEDRQEWSGVIPSSDDSTISMERCFYAPLLLF